LAMGAVSSSYQDAVNYVLNRLATFDPVAAARYRARAQDFEAEAEFSARPLNSVDDAHEPIQADPGCTMAQFAIQNYPVKPLQKRYLVDQSIWNAANSTTRAGLVLHEIIYTDALTYEQTDSDNTRYFNYVISSDEMTHFTAADYLRLVNSVGFFNGESCDFSILALPSILLCQSAWSESEINGNTLVLSNGFPASSPNSVNVGDSMLLIQPRATCLKYLDGSSSLDSCDVTPSAENQQFHLNKISLEITDASLREQNPYATSAGPMTVYSDGVAKDASLIATQSVQVGVSTYQFLGGTLMDFYPSGAILKGTLSGATSVSAGNGSVVQIQGNRETSFYENGAVQCGYLATITPVSVSNNGAALLASGSKVCFDLNGNLDGNSQTVTLAEPTSFNIGSRRVQFERQVSFTSGVIISGYLSIDTAFEISGKTYVFSKDSFISFFGGGNAESGFLANDIQITLQGRALSFSKGTEIGFNVNGSFNGGILASDTSLTIQSQIIQAAQGEVLYWDNGAIAQATIYGGIELKNSQGGVINLGNGFFGKKLYAVQFDRDGLVITSEQVKSGACDPNNNENAIDLCGYSDPVSAAK
jgi:hypothetical protein